MSDFNETDHPRTDGGKFAIKALDEAHVELDSSALVTDEHNADGRQVVHELGGGLWEVRRMLRDAEPIHPDLNAIYKQADQLSAKSDSTREGLLAGYDELDKSLSEFCETARQAYVARDTAEARGEDSDATYAYGAYDWRTAGEALNELRATRAKAVGQVSRDEFQMYSPEGDAAAKQQIDLLASRIDAAVLHPGEMRAAIKVHVKAIAARFPEVHDTEPEHAIVDTLNPLLERRGYGPITRNDLG